MSGRGAAPMFRVVNRETGSVISRHRKLERAIDKIHKAGARAAWEILEEGWLDSPRPLVGAERRAADAALYPFGRP